MAMATFKCEFPRRQAMLTIREPHHKGNGIIEYDKVARVPVFVWPIPTSESMFVVEHQDGTWMHQSKQVYSEDGTYLGFRESWVQDIPCQCNLKYGNGWFALDYEPIETGES